MLAQHSSRYILGLPSSLLILLHCDLLLCFKPRWQYEGYSFCLQICSFAQHLICCQSPIFPQFQRIKKREEQHRVIMKSERSHGLPWWLSGKESTCQCKRCRFNPWVRKIPWRRNWQPTLVFLPGKSHGDGAWWATAHGITKELDTTQPLNNNKSHLKKK